MAMACAPVIVSSRLMSGMVLPRPWAKARTASRSDLPSRPSGASRGARDSCISGTGRGVTCGQSSWALGEVRVKMSAKLRALASRALSG